MKTAVVKSRAALKKSAVISNSRRPKKSAVKSAAVARESQKLKPLLGKPPKWLAAIEKHLKDERLTW